MDLSVQHIGQGRPWNIRATTASSTNVIPVSSDTTVNIDRDPSRLQRCWECAVLPLLVPLGDLENMSGGKRVVYMAERTHSSRTTTVSIMSFIAEATKTYWGRWSGRHA